ncbi:MAG: Crp/Fnr family transcriptional regulator [Flavobacteriales bacterium]|nr:Crp/Fnr family transcriptional regulator [Flavobacteriales bacterium]
MNFNTIKKHLPYLEDELLNEIIKTSQEVEIPKDTVILKKGEYVKVLPITLTGYIKVLHQQEIKDLLLYYIQEGESCIMSFSAGLENRKSKVMAITGEDTTAIIVSIENVKKWLKKYPSINTLFYKLYNQRYEELLTTINDIVFLKLDDRVCEYLKQKLEVSKTDNIKLKHREIAEDLGSSREVITRVLKKLEVENRIEIKSGIIKLL